MASKPSSAFVTHQHLLQSKAGLQLQRKVSMERRPTDKAQQAAWFRMYSATWWRGDSFQPDMIWDLSQWLSTHTDHAKVQYCVPPRKCFRMHLCYCVSLQLFPGWNNGANPCTSLFCEGCALCSKVSELKAFHIIIRHCPCEDKCFATTFSNPHVTPELHSMAPFSRHDNYSVFATILSDTELGRPYW